MILNNYGHESLEAVSRFILYELLPDAKSKSEMTAFYYLANVYTQIEKELDKRVIMEVPNE